MDPTTVFCPNAPLARQFSRRPVSCCLTPSVGARRPCAVSPLVKSIVRLASPPGTRYPQDEGEQRKHEVHTAEKW